MTDSPQSDLHEHEIADGWVRPSTEFPAEPRWGHPDGIQVGLDVRTLPRGLLRVYTPYLRQPTDTLLNFIAVEPIPAGRTERGLSELEHSALDDTRGKRFWAADAPDDPTPRPDDEPARGAVSTVDGVERLTIFILVEPYENGADVYLRLSFRADQPHSFTLATFRRDSSIELAYCVLTATMGNYPRLRELHLANRTVTPAELWPGFAGTEFTEHAKFPLAELERTATGAATVSASPDELEPHTAVYASDTHEHWKYAGIRGVQSWTAAEPVEELEAVVNARSNYWASASPIPGGPSYENFELMEPFRQGREFQFSVEPME
jgi:hypothetical protein